VHGRALAEPVQRQLQHLGHAARDMHAPAGQAQGVAHLPAS
jgi:hypothetical protein